ncbi:hypothetical protein ES703_01234 [subsurface metagenome]
MAAGSAGYLKRKTGNGTAGIANRKSSREVIGMIHWGFLLLAFFAGAAACYSFLWYMGGVYARVLKAFEI